MSAWHAPGDGCGFGRRRWRSGHRNLPSCVRASVARPAALRETTSPPA